MQAKKQLNQFKRIQKHYQMELDTLTAELRKLNLQMSQRKGEFDLVEAELQDAQRPHEGIRFDCPLCSRCCPHQTSERSMECKIARALSSNH